MTNRLDLRAATALVAILLAGVAVLGLAVASGTPAIDFSLPPAIMAWYPTVATDLFDTLATLPVFAGVMVLGAVVCAATGNRAATIAFVLGLCGEIPSTLVKMIVARPRPPTSTEIEAFATAASYPSGHTVRAVLMAGMIVAAFAWLGRGGAIRIVAVLAGVAFAVLVGLARIASGQHWPTDVIGGLMLGVAWLTVCLVVAGRLENRREQPPPDLA